MKLSIITNIPTPYRDTQFALIKERFPNLTVYFTGDKRENRLWNTQKNDFYIFLKKMISFGKFGQLNFGLLDIVRKSDILIIGGYEQPTYILLVLLAKLYKVPTILIFDGIEPSGIERSKNNLTFLLKKFVINKYSAIWGNGSVSYRYFTECFAVDKNKIFNQFLSVDTSLFDKYIEKKNEIKYLMREHLHINRESKIILYSGRFIERKKVLDLINALAIIKQSNHTIDIQLLLIGDKDELSSNIYKSFCEKNSIKSMFLGFIKSEDLYKYYFCSDLLVLPSINEPWGLVVNEAIYSQIPVVVSSDVGAGVDLIENGVNGYVFEKENIIDLSEKIVLSLNIDNDLVIKKSIEIRKTWNFNSSINQLNKAISFILKNKGIQ